MSRTEDYQIIESQIGENVRIYKQAEVKNSVIGDSTSIGDYSTIIDCKIEGNSSINRRNYLFRSDIGKFSYTGIGTMILSAFVGRYCSLSWYVSIGGGNHQLDNVSTYPLWRYKMMDMGIKDQKDNIDFQNRLAKIGRTEIGNDVWFGSKVIVLRGVKIGNGAVIGAGAVVTKDISPYSIVTGVPARTKRKRFDENTIASLERIAWWNWPNELIKQNLEMIYATKMTDDVLKKMLEISESQ